MRPRASLFVWCFAAMISVVTGVHAASTGGLSVQSAGSITSDPTEVISGSRSIKGSYSGANSFSGYLQTNPAALPFARNQTYRLTFRYKILAPNGGFEVLFFSSIAAAQNNFLPAQTITGSPGTTGTVSFVSTLGSFDDYQVLWTIRNTGAISVDDIQITNSAGQVVLSEDAEPGTMLLATFFVSASKPAFIFGEPVKVTAALFDETGKALSPGSISWKATPPTAASIASDGTVTPLTLATFTVTGTASGNQGAVFMQSLPKQIVVTPEKTTMLVGTTQKMRADVLDMNSRPIPNPPLVWRVSSQFFDFSNSATIDATGTLKGLMQARVRVEARIQYNQGIPNFDFIAQGDTLVDIQAPTTYKFERIFLSKPSGAATSTVGPRPAPLIPTETGGFMFAASLNGLGSALLEWNNGGVRPLLDSGRVNLVNGFPLASYVSYARTSAGQVLVEETDLSGGTLVSSGRPGVIAPIFANGSAVFGAQNTSGFDISRNSLADSGAMLIRVGYNDAVTNLYTQGLFRGFGGGISEPIINGRDSQLLSGNVPGYFNNWGIANDGTAWFTTGPQSVLWRSKPGEAPQKIISAGDNFSGEIVNGLTYASTNPLLFVASNGDVLAGINTNRSNKFLLWHSGDSAPSAVLTATTSGIFWYDPNFGALLDTAVPGKPRGLYVWNATSTQPILLLNDSSLDGSPVQEILSAVNTSDGTVYAMVRTNNNPVLIARLSPNPQVILQSGDSVPVNVPPLITALIPGARTGTPLVVVGGGSGSIAKLESNGDITPILAVGSRLPDGKYFAGSKLSMVRSTTDGRIVFAHDSFTNDSSLYTWNPGGIEVTVKAPLKNSDGSNLASPNSVEVNRQGDIAFQMTFAGSAIYRLRAGTLSPVVQAGSIVDGVPLRNLSLKGLDDSGNILVNGTQDDGSGFYLTRWDGSTAHLIMTAGYKMPDGRQVSSLFAGYASACTDSFVAGVFGTVARYQNGSWNYLADPSQLLATGAPANTIRLYDTNRLCDVAFTFQPTGGVTNVGARVSGNYDEVQDLQQLTPDGDLLSIAQMLINDDGTIYILGANDQGQEVVYRATPQAAAPPPANSLNFQISDRGGISNTTSGSGSAVQVGFAEISPNTGSTTPAGIAIFDFRQNGVLISEAAVPASPLIQAGRTYAEIGGPVDTGIAIANPNNQAVTVNFYYTDAAGTNVLSGTTTVAANHQVSAFLDQAPFLSSGTTPNLANVRTFTFSSSLPVGVTALRGYTNQRGEFLITTLPISPISSSSTAGFAFPHFADGGGWTSTLVLINPTDSPITGTAQFYSNGSVTAAGTPLTLTANGTASNSFSYSIPARSSFKLQTSGSGANVQTGWIQVSPSSGSIAPSGLVVFSYQSNGVRVSEAGVPALPSSSAFRLYAEAGDFIQTGIAIANSSSSNAAVNFDLTSLDGSPTGIHGQATVPATGQIAMFLNQIPGFRTLPTTFKGILRVSGANLSVSGLRGRYNERGDFLITTTAPMDETAAPANAPFLFPQLADGGGYTTQVILFSGSTGQSSAGTLQFFSQSGQSLTLTVHY